MEGNEALYQYKAHQGDPAYVKLGQRLASWPGETTFKSVEEGLNLLSTGRSVLHISEGMLKSYLKSSPPGRQRLKVFGREAAATFDCLVLSRNSPLKPMFTRGVLQLFQTGVMNYLVSTYEGNVAPAVQETEAVELNAGQVILVFIGITVALITSLAIFVAEICWKKYIN